MYAVNIYVFVVLPFKQVGHEVKGAIPDGPANREVQPGNAYNVCIVSAFLRPRYIVERRRLPVKRNTNTLRLGYLLNSRHVEPIYVDRVVMHTFRPALLRARLGKPSQEAIQDSQRRKGRRDSNLVCSSPFLFEKGGKGTIGQVGHVSPGEKVVIITVKEDGNVALLTVP